MEIPKTSLAIDLVGFPRHTIDAGSRITFQFDECGAEKIDRDVVQERSELLLLLVPCYFSDTFQRMGHAFPVLSPARGLLVRIPLGPRPWLHRLRNRLPGIVRQLHSYYGGV